MDFQDPETQETEDNEDLLPDIYVEKKSGMIFEVKFFSTFALVRPATPHLYTAINKISLLEFSRRFTEYLGDHTAAREAIRGAAPDFYIGDRH